MNKTKSIIQKQKEIENEKKLIPVFNPNANLLANSKMNSNPKLSAIQPADDSEALVVTSKISRVSKKTRHRANTVDPKVEDQNN
jgi:hypothetical protein